MATKVITYQNGSKRTISITNKNIFLRNELLLAEKDTKCPICLEGDQDELRTYLVLECGHIYHTGCILKWLTKDENNGCPTCRQKFSDQLIKSRGDCIWLDQALFKVTKILKDENPHCYICRNSLEDDRWLELKCGHTWHHICFKSWIEKRNVCPLDNNYPIYK